MSLKSPTDDEVNAAVSVIQRDYYSDVRSVAKYLVQEFYDKDTQEPRDDIDLSDEVHTAVDSTQRVIYTWQARLGMLVTDNTDAWEDVFNGSGETPTVEQMMYFAMVADVMDYLGNKSFVEAVLTGKDEE